MPRAGASHCPVMRVVNIHMHGNSPHRHGRSVRPHFMGYPPLMADIVIPDSLPGALGRDRPCMMRCESV